MGDANALADLIRCRFATEGLEIQGIEGTCVHASVPFTVTNLTGLLNEVYEDTGSEADLTLTADGAMLQFWASPGVRPRRTYWQSVLLVLVAMLAAARLYLIEGGVPFELPEMPSTEGSYLPWWFQAG